MPAFRVLWLQMPKYRWLVAPTGWPIVKPVSEALYDHVLAPLSYGWFMRRKAKAA
jgi:predicted DCC family thiol-disulfide oxidoreductase YuxK